MVPSFIVHGSRVTGRKEDGEASKGRKAGREDLLPAHPILCQSSLAQVQVRYACASSFLPFVISFVHNIFFHPKTIQNLMNAKASPRPFGVLPSRLGAYSPLPSSSRGIRSLPENLSFVTVGQLNVTLASPTLSLLFSISVGRGRRERMKRRKIRSRIERSGGR